MSISDVSLKRSRMRRTYGKGQSLINLNDLLSVQKQSYEEFLQFGVSKKKNRGLHEVFSLSFPVSNNEGSLVLDYVNYELEDTVYNEEDCRKKGLSYVYDLSINLKLSKNVLDKNTGVVETKSIKKQSVHLGKIPKMTQYGSFIINGTERVVVSQIHKSPGIYFSCYNNKQYSSKNIYSASIIPKRGIWIDIEFDLKGLLYLRVDKRRKILLTTFLRCLNKSCLSNHLTSDLNDDITNEDIVNEFSTVLDAKKVGEYWKTKFISDFYINKKYVFDILDENNNVVVPAQTLITKSIARKILKNGDYILVPSEYFYNQYIASPIIHKDKILFPTLSMFSEDAAEILEKSQITEFKFILIDDINYTSNIVNTLLYDRVTTRNMALKEFYKLIKVSEAPNVKSAEDFLYNLIFNNNLQKYDLSEVGRYKLNLQLGRSSEVRSLEAEDIIFAIKRLVKVKSGQIACDDIDDLSNRRLRSVGELLETEIRTLLSRVERTIIDRMSIVEDPMPNNLIQAKLLQPVFREFFGSSQLSQFMDQTNPLSEITHKRRISALGPKGITRDRASFEVRDVHNSHYGRVCPIETPEGPNIGLINSLALYSRVNKYGFLETPYVKVKNGNLTDKVEYLTSMQEKDVYIATFEHNMLADAEISCRCNGDYIPHIASDVDYMDIAANQTLSVAASLIPFLENDDSNRALMGTNMQRQAVPLLYPKAPLVGTGVEKIVAHGSGAALTSEINGEVVSINSTSVIVMSDINSDDVQFVKHDLSKFRMSNYGTCINQRPIVNVGNKVSKGDILADGFATEGGELALGNNILVAFVPWKGYNFEDAILVSEKVVRDSLFTSIHIEEIETSVMDTKLGPEEVTQDIPNVNEHMLRHLDDSGVVYIGAHVKGGDIIVGKVTPKAESISSPEEKLLRSIFGEKAATVKNTSLKVPTGTYGTVIDVQIASRKGTVIDDRSESIYRIKLNKLNTNYNKEVTVINRKIKEEFLNITNGAVIKSSKDVEIDSKSPISEATIKDIYTKQLFNLTFQDSAINKNLEVLKSKYNNLLNARKENYDIEVSKLSDYEEIPNGVLKVVKVFIAVKRNLQTGDKMAGRHGNKGVVSKICAIEDMPYMADGRSVDICLNPLGVPSRMNLGQILETHLGWACREIGYAVQKKLDLYDAGECTIADIRSTLNEFYGHNEKDHISQLSDNGILNLAHSIKEGMPIATPVFDGAVEEDINDLYSKLDIESSGQQVLYDGQTGEQLDRKVTVGYLYMLKLHHLVDDKMHARSVGPYSLITQQPLGGKAQFGGQRFGEMEVWALEAYGASYTLQEMLTVKSDDQEGRSRVYEAIVRQEDSVIKDVPESFKVLVRELRSLALDLDIIK